MSGLIAIVGRPNVGKSALFNRIAGRRIAIVHDQPGVTRDRLTAEAEWGGRPFTLADTGGIGLVEGEKAANAVLQATLEQVGLAIDAAQVIILVVNAREGLAPLDAEVAGQLRKAGKPVLLAVNKVDYPDAEPAALDFARLGFERVFPVSAIHDRGIAPLMDTAIALLPPLPTAPAREAEPGLDVSSTSLELKRLKLAIVGRPNVGKSSLINALTNSARVIVSAVPGTTRDAIDVPFELETEGFRERYVLIDTAGIRKTRRVADSVEFFSVKRAEDSIRRCDVAVLVLDAEAGILEQDKKIADLIVGARKSCIIAINKWDLAQAEVKELRKKRPRERPPARPENRQSRQLTTLAEFGRWVQEKLFFLDYAPVIFTSAVSGLNLDRLMEAVRYVRAQLAQRIPTALLNRALRAAVERRQPVSSAGYHLKFFYATQTNQQPPTFVLFVNRPELLSVQYAKYLTNHLRQAFGYEGCPMVLVPRARPRPPERQRRQPKAR